MSSLWRALLLAVMIGASGCALQSQRMVGQGPAVAADLITGVRVFGEPVGSFGAPAAATVEPSAAMRRYVAAIVDESGPSSARLRQLVAGLLRDGYLETTYAADHTLTAAETFDGRVGNCLSYTNMFVALAREAGLDAHFQVVEVPPTWNADSGFLIRYTHINVFLENVSLDNQPGQSVIVDFNDVRPDPSYPARKVSDDYARALFHANRSVDLLRGGEPRLSFAQLRRAIEIEPNNPNLWVNLGAFYAIRRDYASSVEAYQAALQLDPHSKPALSGLARSYDNVGDHRLAALYEEKVRHYRERNPYFHFALAQAAYQEARYERSLKFIQVAIDLKRRTPTFYLLKGMVEQKLGDEAAAEVSFGRARRYGLEHPAKLDLLNSLAGAPVI